MRNAALPVILAVAAALLAGGCSTISGGGLGKAPMTPFRPAVATVPVQWVEGNYPNLFDSASQATWPMPPAPIEPTPEPPAEPAAQPADAAAEPAPEPPAPAPVPTMYLDIECRLASLFADSSIAYDVVGLRGVDIYLLTPDGAQVRPVQVQRGQELTEEPRGALRFFARTNHLVFPLNTTNLAVPAGAPVSVRLMIEGYGSAYQFEWPAYVAPGTPPPPKPLPVKETARKVWRGTRNAAHNFD